MYDSKEGTLGVKLLKVMKSKWIRRNKRNQIKSVIVYMSLFNMKISYTQYDEVNKQYRFVSTSTCLVAKYVDFEF